MGVFVGSCRGEEADAYNLSFGSTDDEMLKKRHDEASLGEKEKSQSNYATLLRMTLYLCYL
jgi:hypothetical protein